MTLEQIDLDKMVEEFPEFSHRMVEEAFENRNRDHRADGRIDEVFRGKDESYIKAVCRDAASFETAKEYFASIRRLARFHIRSAAQSNVDSGAGDDLDRPADLGEGATREEIEALERELDDEGAY